MSSEVVIQTERLGKRYELYDRPQDRLKQVLLSQKRQYFHELWAVHDLDLEVYRGESLGILGVNGSGKSTLLAMICGNLTPSRGAITITGRVSALLELGAGFNPEFTGLENVYLNATVLGLSHEEIDKRLDSIIGFADIGKYIDQPVKFYSSGMYARLAFAVAVNVDPDIFVVDETLAVGDAAFQRKCFARIQEIKQKGATILFVSHATKLVLELCDRAMVLHEGEALYVGETKHAVGYYQKLSYAQPSKQPQIVEEIRSASANAAVSQFGTEDDAAALLEHCGETGRMESKWTPVEETDQHDAATPRPHFDPNLVSKSAIRYVENGAAISNPRIVGSNGAIVNCLISGDTYSFQFDVIFHEDSSDVRFFNLIKTVTGVELGGAAHPSLSSHGLDMAAGQNVTVSFKFRCSLGEGSYFLNCGVGGIKGQSLHRVIDALIFRVEPVREANAFGAVDFEYAPSFSQNSDVEDVEPTTSQ